MRAQKTYWYTTNYTLEVNEKEKTLTLKVPLRTMTLDLTDKYRFNALKLFLKISGTSALSEDDRKAETFNFIMNFAAACGGWTSDRKTDE